jgi:putative tryptophan/tyrosine transport system substrate-binding protein
MKRRDVLAFGLAAMWSLAVHAQAARAPQVGIVFVGNVDAARHQGFVAAMERLGYREGATVGYELRSSGVDQLSRVVGDLVALRPDIVVSWTSTAARALANATEDIPIVMGVVGDPVALGLTTSFAHPTRNVTGFTTLNDTLAAKRLELLREIMPSASRIALLWVPTNPQQVLLERQTTEAAQKLGIELLSSPLSSFEEIQAALQNAIHGQAAAIIVAADPLTLENQRFIIDQCLKLKLPAIHTYISEARSGALLTYGVDTANYGALADYVDRLLRGAKVADLPFQEPTSIKLAVNLKTASALGITVPASLLARADEVIE